MSTGTHPLPSAAHAEPAPPHAHAEPAPPHVLDNPVWAALHGPHRHLAETRGRAARYPVDVSPFAALADPADLGAWDDLAALAGPAAPTVVTGLRPPPDGLTGWQAAESLEGVQLIGTALRAEPAPEAVRLGPADVPEILELVALTRPGPFLPRTVELGTYLGIRHEGRLVALAGERLRPPGFTEISAVCTHPDHRGRGLATRLVRAVAAGIRERGETPFLHAAASNTGAIRLYESIGFTLRRRPGFHFALTPGASEGGGAE